MMKLFWIYPSSVQLGIITAFYLISGFSALYYLNDPLFKYLIALLSGLLCLSEWITYKASAGAWLTLDMKQKSIRLKEADESYFYIKYKVYPTRWFVILVLIDAAKRRNLILNSDRFETVSKYNLLRYCLTRMESSE